MVFAPQCSMILNVIEHKNVIEYRYSWHKCQLKLVFSYKTTIMLFAVPCSMLLNVIEHKNVIEHIYSWSKHQSKLVSFVQDYCNGICSPVFYFIKCNRT